MNPKHYFMCKFLPLMPNVGQVYSFVLGEKHLGPQITCCSLTQWCCCKRQHDI